MLSFKDNDAGYIAWIEAHPDGFVINTSRNPNPDYLVAHRASCHTISKEKSPDHTWTERT